MNVLLPLPIVLPLFGAALSMPLHGRPALQRAWSAVVLAGTLAASVALLVQVGADGTAAVGVGGWGPSIGITLVADRFAAIMLAVSTTMLAAVLAFAIGHARTADDALFFHPVYLVLAAGVSASCLAGDLFNLFVAFEVMLTSSYVLITLGSRAEQIRHGMTYIVINLLASMFFVTAVGLVYAATGTVNMAELSGRLADLPEGVRGGLGLLLLVVFGVKAAIFPLFFWLPDSYPTAPTPVTAIFAGLLTKIGVYAIIRTQTLLFPAERPSTLLLVVAGLTMVVGVLGAIAQEDIKRLLSFHIVSQIGYMIFGLGLFSVAGLAGAIFFIVHQIVVKTSLFLVGGVIEQMTRETALNRIGGLLHRSPVLGLVFAVAAISLAGLPPSSGFVGKLALVDAGLAQDQYAIVAVSLVVSVLTMFSMTKIWSGAFWGEVPRLGPGTAPAVVEPPRASLLAPTAALVVLALAIAAFAGPLYDLCHDAATAIASSDDYVQAVRGT